MQAEEEKLEASASALEEADGNATAAGARMLDPDSTKFMDAPVKNSAVRSAALRALRRRRALWPAPSPSPQQPTSRTTQAPSTTSTRLPSLRWKSSTKRSPCWCVSDCIFCQSVLLYDIVMAAAVSIGFRRRPAGEWRRRFVESIARAKTRSCVPNIATMPSVRCRFVRIYYGTCGGPLGALVAGRSSRLALVRGAAEGGNRRGNCTGRGSPRACRAQEGFGVKLTTNSLVMEDNRLSAEDLIPGPEDDPEDAAERGAAPPAKQ